MRQTMPKWAGVQTATFLKTFDVHEKLWTPAPTSPVNPDAHSSFIPKTTNCIWRNVCVRRGAIRTITMYLPPQILRTVCFPLRCQITVNNCFISPHMSLKRFPPLHLSHTVKHALDFWKHNNVLNPNQRWGLHAGSGGSLDSSHSRHISRSFLVCVHFTEWWCCKTRKDIKMTLSCLVYCSWMSLTKCKGWWEMNFFCFNWN